MRYIFILFAALLFSCNNGSTDTKAEETVKEVVKEEAKMAYYGDKITPNGAISVADCKSKVIEKGSVDCVVEGEITATCIKKGCWMTVKTPDGDDMRVTFKDYGFFVPTEGQEGKKAIMRGKAVMDTTSVADLQHYAEDAGKTPEEIAAITEPEYALSFEADGVIIKE